MSVPDYQSIMLPLLEYASDGKEHLMRTAYDDLAVIFNLTDEERKNFYQAVVNQHLRIASVGPEPI